MVTQQRSVLFVCLHGSAKSVIAAEHFNRLAADRGSGVRATSAGTEPDEAIPARVAQGLRDDGMDVEGRRPRRPTPAEVEGSALVVTFGCDLGELASRARRIERWDDVPAVSEDFKRARDVIVARVVTLLDDPTLAKTPTPTLLLTRHDVRTLLTLDDCIEAVGRAFARHAARKDPPAALLSVRVPGGGFHAKAAVLDGHFATKLNANFPGNPSRNGRPTIQGLVALFDATDGRLLAVMDSIEITILRTAAATALAARYLAREDSATATICGCGAQGHVQLEAIVKTRPIKRVFAYDADQATAARFARERSAALGIDVQPVADLSAAVRQSDVCVTCTTSRRPLIGPADVRPGTFIAAVGADSPEKQELEPALLSAARVVVDNLDQSAMIGELHHAIERGLVTRESVYAELGELIAGTKPGRMSRDEITIFDSTGTAVQDVAAAAVVYERSRTRGVVRGLDLAS